MSRCIYALVLSWKDRHEEALAEAEAACAQTSTFQTRKLNCHPFSLAVYCEVLFRAGSEHLATAQCIGNEALHWMTEEQQGHWYLTPLRGVLNNVNAALCRTGHLSEILPSELQILAPIGEGGQSTIFEAWYQETVVAVKFYKESSKLQLQECRELCTEIKAANRLDSPHVMRFLGFVRDPVRGLGLVMPRMRGSLQELVLVPDGPDPSQRVLFAHLCGMSVMALHEMGVCHQDIKSHNFLYDGEGPDLRIVVTDLGSAKVSTATMATSSTQNFSCSTLFWCAPEFVRNPRIPVTLARDVYAFGVVMWEIATSRAPLTGCLWRSSTPP